MVINSTYKKDKRSHSGSIFVDMTFEEYLKSKKIDSAKFHLNEGEIYDEYQTLFNQMHPSSFTAQKLFVINKLRRKYLLVVENNEKLVEKSMPSKPKVMMRPKPKNS